MSLGVAGQHQPWVTPSLVFFNQAWETKVWVLRILLSAVL